MSELFRVYVYDYGTTKERIDHNKILHEIFEMELTKTHQKDGKFTAGMRSLLNFQLQAVREGKQTRLVKANANGSFPHLH